MLESFKKSIRYLKHIDIEFISEIFSLKHISGSSANPSFFVKEHHKTVIKVLTEYYRNHQKFPNPDI